MKRTIAMLLSLILVLAFFAGCTTDAPAGTEGTKPTQGAQPTETPDPTEDPQPTDSSEPPAGDIPYITDGLVARYDFEDGANIGKDVSGNDNHLVVWNLEGKTVGQVQNSLSAALGNAAEFNGGALLAALPLEDCKEPSKDFVDELPGSYTITFFARNTRTDTPPDEDHRNLICNGFWSNPTSPNLEFSFTYKNDGGYDSFATYLNYGATMSGLYFRKFVWQVDNGSFYEYGKVDTAWYHYALVVDTEKNTIDLYIDGKLVKSNDAGQPLATQSEEVPFSVGGMAVPAEEVPLRDLLFGEIDDLRIYDRVLTVYEIGNIQRLKG